MKRILLTLATLLLAAPAFAGSIAAPSLSSLVASSNPATEGLKVAPTEINYQSTSLDWPTSKTTHDNAAGVIRWSWGYYGLSHQKSGGNTVGYSTTGSFGYRNAGLSLALFGTSGTYTSKVSQQGVGLSWAMSRSLLLGGTYQASTLDNSTQTDYGVAFMLPGSFKLEYASAVSDNGAGTTSTQNTGILEVQWQSWVLGYQTSGAGTTMQNQTYLAWESEKTGLTAKVAQVDLPNDTTFTSGVTFGLGWKF